MLVDKSTDLGYNVISVIMLSSFKIIGKKKIFRIRENA